jgi:hypothetical protein
MRKKKYFSRKENSGLAILRRFIGITFSLIFLQSEGILLPSIR